MGCSIWIFWPDERDWFKGTVAAHNGRKHQVLGIVVSLLALLGHSVCGGWQTGLGFVSAEVGGADVLWYGLHAAA